MGSRIKKLLILLIMVLGVVLFASEEKKAPNEIVKDNPEREVTTVESMKVRDHATMSLSVTKKNEKVIEGELIGDTLKIKLPIKGINENTLDRMVKTKEGKKLVIESKSRVNPRMARMVTNTTKKIPTQEEMNNLTLEQVKAMMNNSDTKEIETQSKGVKNYIAVENESGIDVEVLDVNRNEDIYVNVEENGEVVDKYRVAISNQVSTREFTVPSSISKVFLHNLDTLQVVGTGSNKIWLAHKAKTFSAQIHNLQRMDFTNSLSGIKLDDEFLNKDNKKIELNFSHGDFISGASLRLRSNITSNELAPMFSDILGSKNEGIGYFVTSPTKGVFYQEYATTEGKLYEGKNVNDPKVGAVNGFKRIVFLEKLYNGLKGEAQDPYLKNGTITGIGFELDIYFKNKLMDPGLYVTVGNLNVKLTINGGETKNFRASEIYADVGDHAGNGTVKIPTEKIKNSITSLGTIDTANWTLLDNEPTKLSFMKSNDNPSSYSDIGLFINGDYQRQIARYVTGKETNVHTISYTQGNKEQRFKIRVSQKEGEYAKVEILPIKLQNPDNTNETPQVVFYIVQGRSTGSNLIEYRKAKYTVNFPRIEEIGDKIDINLIVDPRVAYTTKATDTSGQASWMTLDRRYGKWIDSDKIDLSEMISVDKVYNDSTLTVNEVVSVEGESKETGTSEYDRFRKKDTTDRLDIAFKRGVTFTQLSQNSSLMISPLRDIAYKILYKASDNKKYRSTITMSHAVKPNDSYFKEDIGYDGDGRIDLSGKDPKEYTLLHPSLSGEINNTKITLDYHDGYLPTFNGLIDGETNNQIVTKYRVKVGSESNFREFTNIGTEISINNNLGIILSKTTGVNDKKNIKINKKTDETFNYTLLIEYYCKNVKLGEYTLEVTNTNRPKNLGVAQIDLDARISQVNDNSSWIRLSDKTLFHLTNQSSIGQYTEFIKDASSFSNAGTLSDYDSGTIASIENINGSSTLYDTIKGTTTYTYLSSENEAAFPKGITFGEFKKTGVESKLIISKYDVKNSNHNGNNNFSIKLGNGIRFTGNIMENYKGQDGNNINLPIVNPENTIFKGKGKLNLVKSTVGTTYSFDAGQSGNISGNGDTNVVLKITEGKSLDATGVLPSNTNQSIANRMVIQYGGSIIATVNGNVGDKLESGDLTIDEAKIKIGINSNGELIMTKVEDGNITSSMLAIDYYYINKTNTNVQNDIHLGSFELTLMNPIIESSTTPTVIIDKRFAENVHYNWLFRDGRASNDLYKYPENAQNYEVLFKYNGDLSSANGEIRDAIGMEGRIHRTNSSDTKGYRLYHINDTEWRGEAAVPISGLMNDLNNIITISKGNSENSISKENKFSLLFEEDGEMKIYKGNVTENIVGNGVSRGSGEVTFISTDTDITYEFPTTLNNQETNVIGNGIDNRTLVMKNVEATTGVTQALPNGNGLTEIVGKNQVIANKITVMTNGTTSSNNNTKEVTVDNVTFGIGDNGGLTLKKGSNFNPSEDKVYTIKFYYKSPNNDTDGDVELSSFDLTIRKSIFEIDGDGVLNFGDMVYDSSYPYVTQGGIFYVKCNDPAMIEGKKVEFSVDRDKVQPMKNTNGQTGDQNEVPLVNTQVQTRSNGKFYLQSTADLSGRPNTGKYEGEIEVIVTIQDKQP